MEIGLPEIIILLVFSQVIHKIVTFLMLFLCFVFYSYLSTDMFLQYIPRMMKGDKPIFDRFAVIFSVAIVWIYAHLLTVGGAYKNSAPKTQITCRTDRAGIIGGAPW